MTIETSDNLAAAARPGFAAGYAARDSASDEMVEPDGSLRPHWRMLVSQFDDLGAAQLPERWEHARRIIRENGITHNVYGDPNGLDRPWNLDLVPLLLPMNEWRTVGDGLAQRARLLDALLADLYGPARSVAEGWLPPELLYANPAFLRPCHGITPPRGMWVHLYAADLVRLGDAHFEVLGDRTQNPSGAGYSLENRIVLSSVLPTLFRQCNVHRLAPFFITLRHTLRTLAPAHRENPRVVLLTPGPYNETYFEHAYLARYLGYTLVQGNDLTVRNGYVYLKTLSGLQRVDVILRRVDDDFCDPLELYQGSYLGVPGLVEAVRAGNVAVANALGSGMVQGPAFLSFLPTLCRKLLGEELKLPSVQTWWCGNAQSLSHVLANLHRLVIKPAFPTAGADPEFGEELTREELGTLKDRISARPFDFVAQEHVASRTVPVLTNAQVEVRRFVVRAYAVADSNTWAVMPGGLTRVTPSGDSLVVSMQRGGGSKDTWILANGPVGEATLLASMSAPVELNRGGGELTSRVADDLFWLGRYVQRAEASARVARCLFGRVMEQGRSDVLNTARVLSRTLLGHGRFRLEESSFRMLVSETFSAVGPSGLRPAINNIGGLVRGLRDRLSSDGWRILQGIEREVLEFKPPGEEDQFGRVIETLNHLTMSLMAFGGVVAESMTRGQAWRFLELGGRIERAIALARIVRSTLVESAPDESPLLDAVLEIADSSLTYRRRYLTQLDVAAVVDLVVADEQNPRAVAYQLAMIEQHLAALPRDATHPQQSPDCLAVLKLRTQIKLADLRALCQTDKRGIRPGLDAMLLEVIDSMGKISEFISQIYFSHAAISRTLHALSEERAK